MKLRKAQSAFPFHETGHNSGPLSQVGMPTDDPERCINNVECFIERFVELVDVADDEPGVQSKSVTELPRLLYSHIRKVNAGHYGAHSGDGQGVQSEMALQMQN